MIESLKNKIEELKKLSEHHQANFHSANGALNITKQILEEFERLESEKVKQEE